MQQPSRTVSSSQPGPHQDLARRVQRYREHRWRRPVAEHSRQAFERCAERVAAWRGDLILDAGCGTGASTIRLAAAEPGALVIGIDKSLARLGRGLGPDLPDNVSLLRADLVDFWRLAAAAGWRLNRHCILYPNPWPKRSQLGRRWHAHPVFPVLLELGGQLELRSNWEIYALEWQQALALHGLRSRCETLEPDGVPDGVPGEVKEAISPFERKYLASGQRCWRVCAEVGP